MSVSGIWEDQRLFAEAACPYQMAMEAVSPIEEASWYVPLGINHVRFGDIIERTLVADFLTGARSNKDGFNQLLTISMSCGVPRTQL